MCAEESAELGLDGRGGFVLEFRRYQMSCISSGCISGVFGASESESVSRYSKVS